MSNETEFSSPDVVVFKRPGKIGHKAKKRKRIAVRDGIRCYLCGRIDVPLDELRIEHVIPLGRGGTHDLRNLKLACAPCDIAKGSMTAEEYRESLRCL
jgi:5-methylcytosine-specific restriction endonuclease McrA